MWIYVCVCFGIIGYVCANIKINEPLIDIELIFFNYSY